MKGIKRLKIQKNTMSINDLTIIAEGKVPPVAVVCDYHENYETDSDGKRTTKVVSHTLECTDPVTYGSFNLKVTGSTLPFTHEDFENATEPIMIEIPLKTTIIKPYEISYGKVKVSIISPSISIYKGGDK